MGKKVKVVKSHAPHGHSKGGWSQKRFERLQAQARHEYLKRVGDHVNEYFSGQEDLEGIIVGGPGSLKHDLIKGNYIKPELRDKILHVVDTGYGGELGMRELIQKSDDVLKDTEYMKEKHIVQLFLEHVSKDDGTVEYGTNEVKDLIESGAVETVIVSESVHDDLIGYLEVTCPEFGTAVRVISAETEEGKMLETAFGGVATFLRWDR